MNFISNKKERIRFIKFSFVGFTGSIVDFGMMNLLRLIFNVPLVWAQAISFVCAVLNNFLWNRYWTYPEYREEFVGRQLFQFSIVSTIGIILRTPLVPWFDRQILSLLNDLSLDLPLNNTVISENIALAISITLVTFWNFFANRFWTFGSLPGKGKDTDHSSKKSVPTGSEAE